MFYSKSALIRLACRHCWLSGGRGNYRTITDESKMLRLGQTTDYRRGMALVREARVHYVARLLGLSPDDAYTALEVHARTDDAIAWLRRQSTHPSTLAP